KRALPYFPPDWKPSTRKAADRYYYLLKGASHSQPGRSYVLRDGSGRLRHAEMLEQALGIFESDSRLFIGEMTTQKVFLHAGVVGWRGRAIVIPGRSWSGKTTLVAALVRAGATYFSDEYAVLDRQGRVHPYPKPLSVRDRKTAKQRNYPVEKLGGVAATKPLP